MKQPPIERRIYTPADWAKPLAAAIHRPAGPGPHPAVLVVHGGSWSGRSPADMSRIARHLAARGMVAVNAAYRLAPDHPFPAPLNDLRQALTWMADQADDLGIDADRVGAFGYSAGAHLVSLLALTQPSRGPGPAARLRAVVAGGIPADLTRWPQSPVVKRFLGVSFRADPQLWVEASPQAHVHAGSPPFFLYHGGLDRLVEPGQSRRFHQRLGAAGARSELHEVPWHGHLSMFLLNRSGLRRGAAFLAGALAAGPPAADVVASGHPIRRHRRSPS